MRLSILVPVYNVAIYLSALLQELLTDLPADMELVFYDDASTDDSLVLIQTFQKKHPCVPIRILQGSKNVGLTIVRSKLIDSTNAEYIWFVDADDKVESSLFDRILLILKCDKPDVLLFNYDVFYDKTEQIKYQEKLSFCPQNSLVHTSGKQIYRTAILDGKHYFWNKIFRRELIVDVVDYKIPAYEDIAYTPILLSQCRSFYYFAETVVHYRIRDDSIAQKMGVKQAYGIRAYMEQALYASTVVHDQKSQAYLLYKVCVYYFRILKNIEKSNISKNEKEQLLTLSNQLFSLKQFSEWKIVGLLFRAGMLDKAVKLIYKNIWFKINRTKLQ
jgi:glycosyltransferase involved in cell wall biosynthesis